MARIEEMMEKEQAKLLRLDFERRKKYDKEIEDCTFKPQVLTYRDPMDSNSE